uniref:Uncharacterized protein n=1 Tax=Toxoplasma gondii COUG TaxID=1074873 RepID=A0A2G8Y2B1_TOXGO|nr:hypothetical protein TGCOUG_272593 [Toxoplasma gondii COUG]
MCREKSECATCGRTDSRLVKEVDEREEAQWKSRSEGEWEMQWTSSEIEKRKGRKERTPVKRESRHHAGARANFGIELFVARRLEGRHRESERKQDSRKPEEKSAEGTSDCRLPGSLT